MRMYLINYPTYIVVQLDLAMFSYTGCNSYNFLQRERFLEVPVPENNTQVQKYSLLSSIAQSSVCEAKLENTLVTPFWANKVSYKHLFHNSNYRILKNFTKKANIFIFRIKFIYLSLYLECYI